MWTNCHSFSILHRIEWVETPSEFKVPETTAGLSVSCIGSNGLKLELTAHKLIGYTTFSILYRIEWVETSVPARSPARW